ncbi:hypothetical protein [Gordonia aichiensis]|uniref:hypothetical protein n=1 Tax=Gordonia aichiensis TaxID=36820 RepID=UPI003267630B
MHAVVMIIAGFITLLLAGPALLRGGLLRAWLSVAASILPCGILYLAFADDSQAKYLWPAFILLTIALIKAATILKEMVENAPRSLNNAPVTDQPHWAAS